MTVTARSDPHFHELPVSRDEEVETTDATGSTSTLRGLGDTSTVRELRWRSFFLLNYPGKRERVCKVYVQTSVSVTDTETVVRVDLLTRRD